MFGCGDGRLNGLQFLYQALDFLNDSQLKISEGKDALVHVSLLSMGLKRGKGHNITAVSQSEVWVPFTLYLWAGGPREW